MAAAYDALPITPLCPRPGPAPSRIDEASVEPGREDSCRAIADAGQDRPFQMDLPGPQTDSIIHRLNVARLELRAERTLTSTLLLGDCLRACHLADHGPFLEASLFGCAWLAANELHDARAAALLGAVNALGRNAIPPPMARGETHFITAVRERLGDTVFEEIQREGAASDRDDLVRRTLAWLDSVSRTGFGLETEKEVGPVEREDGDCSLTRRERQVLKLLAVGASNREIAAQLYISPLTAGTHIKHLFRKLGVRSRTAAVTAGLRAGQIELS